MRVIKFILDLGPSVMMPIIVTILGLIFREKFSKAFRAGLTIGIGFVGINLVIGLLVSTLGPVTQAFVKNTGLHLNVMDVGWPVSAAISFGTTIVPAVFIAGFLINLLMLWINWTKTLDVDLWNYWHFIFAGALVMYLTNNYWLGVIAAAITMIIILKLADRTASYVSDFFGIPGVSLPHTETVSWALLGIGLNKVLDKIPVINKIDISPEVIEKRFGILGEPMIIGLVLGGLLAAIARYDIKGIVQVAVSMSAVMFILPRMVKILMEGLLPLSESARTFVTARAPNRKLYIGLDAAIVIGHPSVLATGIIMIPITLLLAAILPGNRVLPFTDLAVLPFLMIWAVAPSKGNVFRGLIIGTIFMVCILYIATDIAGVSTLMAKGVGFPFPQGVSEISSLDGGGHLVPYIIFKIVQLIRNLI